MGEAGEDGGGLKPLAGVYAVFVREIAVCEADGDRVEVLFDEHAFAEPVGPVVGFLVDQGHALPDLFGVVLRVLFVEPLQGYHHVCCPGSPPLLVELVAGMRLEAFPVVFQHFMHQVDKSVHRRNNGAR